MLARACSLVLVVAAIGCAPKEPVVPPSSRPDPLTDAVAHPAQLAARVAEVRMLEELKPTPIHFCDKREFATILNAKLQREPHASDNLVKNAFYSAFGFPLPSAKEGNTLAAVEREQVIAMYDPTSASVYVRRDALELTHSAKDVMYALAHELAHSLQHQHFAIPDRQLMSNEDQRLATHAMIEGDAMLTMLAFATKEEEISLKRSLVRAERGFDEAALTGYLKDPSNARALFSAPAIVRERVLFPYFDGLNFMGVLYRAGGFSLVNRVYEHPPTTTEQILHPEKYLAGETAAVIPIPQPLGDYRTIATGHLGELQTRVALAPCNSDEDARTAAAGWGGDSFAIALGHEQRVMLLWNTVWDSERDAQEFESAAHMSARCWSVKSPLSGGPDRTVVLRKKDRVAVVRSTDVGMSVAATEALIASNIARPPSHEPFGKIWIPPVRAPASTHPDVVSRRRFVSQRLGIVAPLPPGFFAQKDNLLVMERFVPSYANAAIGISDRLTSAAGLTATLDDFADGLEETLTHHELVVMTRDRWLDTPLGLALERTWAAKNTGARARLLVIPICHGTGAILISEVWADADAKAHLDLWLDSVVRITDKDPPICAELDP